MYLLTDKTAIALWQRVIQHAEGRCAIALGKEFENYLISLLIRYTTQPEIAKQVMSIAYLDALSLGKKERSISLQQVGDQCLLLAGLFPQIAERRHVKITYFVHLGRTAYAEISEKSNDFFWTLAWHFITLMDVLQSIRPIANLQPLQAYELWDELGSQRALQILKEYSNGLPIK